MATEESALPSMDWDFTFDDSMLPTADFGSNDEKGFFGMATNHVKNQLDATKDIEPGPVIGELIKDKFIDMTETLNESIEKGMEKIRQEVRNLGPKE